MILVNVALIFQVMISRGYIEASYVSEEDYNVVKCLRINMIVCIFFNVMELSSRIRIFNYFAYFVQ